VRAAPVKRCVKRPKVKGTGNVEASAQSGWDESGGFGAMWVLAAQEDKEKMKKKGRKRQKRISIVRRH
jgi:hypothetical protein